MPRVVWSAGAVRELGRLRTFLSSKNSPAAARAVASIRRSVHLLEQHPDVGRIVDEMPPEFRLWPAPFACSGYVVLYRADRDDVVIVAVRHGREAGF